MRSFIIWFFVLVLVVLSYGYWQLFVRTEKITEKLPLAFCINDSKGKLHASLCESAKYIISSKIERTADTIKVLAYTTSIYNIFYRKGVADFYIDIQGEKYIKIGEKVMAIDALHVCEGNSSISSSHLTK